MDEILNQPIPEINENLKNKVGIFSDNELDKNSVCSKMEHTAEDGKTYQTEY